LNLLFNTDKKTPLETGLSLASNGQITFASGQTFPGTGTITGVTAGPGLTGGGTTGTVTVGLTNTCASGQVLEWSGSAWACAGVGTGTITGVTAGTDLTGGGASGNVTLNLNTSKTDARYAQLGASNSFSGVQSITGSSSAQTLTVTQTGTGATGDGIHGITSATGGTGVFGEGAIAIQGYANTGGLAGLFSGATEVTGNGNNTVIGDPGCGSGYAGIGFINATLTGCTNYALTGGAAGDTYVNSNGTAWIHFRSNNNELATIDNLGNVNVIGQNGAGNLTVARTVTAAVGIVGNNGSSTGYGVVGNATAGSGTTAGVLGTKLSNLGFGVEGTPGTLSATGKSLLGTFGAGVWGDTGPDLMAIGVMGTADDNIGGYFQNNSKFDGAIFAVNTSTGGGCSGCAIVLETSGGADSGHCTIDAGGDVACTGEVGADASVDSGARKVSLYAMQSPENWFEDFGSGTLSSGAATIPIDPTFAQTVNAEAGYRVFLTPDGDCQGLYVSQKSASSFEVRELGGGRSNVAFDYRIVAKRTGYENVRLADVTEKYKRLASQPERLKSRSRQTRAAAQEAK
jgi:hypothetical protein